MNEVYEVEMKENERETETQPMNIGEQDWFDEMEARTEEMRKASFYPFA